MQLPSMDSYSELWGCFTKFGVEIAEADKPEPYFNVSDRPLDGLFGQLLVEYFLLIHYRINYYLNITSFPQNIPSPHHIPPTSNILKTLQ